MAKRTSNISSPTKISNGVMRFKVDDHLSKAIEKQQSSDVYSNYVHIVVSEHDVMLDFYRVSRIPGKVDIELVHNQKIFLPIAVGKGLAEALNKTLSSYEEGTGIEIETDQINEAISEEEKNE